MVANKAFVVKKWAAGILKEPDNIAVETRDFDLDAAPPSGGVVVKVLAASLDPYMRRKIRDPNIKDYTEAYQPDEPMPSGCLGKIVKSAHKDFKEGDKVLGMIPMEQYTALDAEQVAVARLRKLQNPHGIEDLTVFLGSLGMPGLTAYSSLYDIGQPKKGEIIFISAASGAVGQLVGQLAKHEGLKVIGSVGSDDKLDYILKDLGFDAAFNYRKESPSKALPRLAPDGIDIYYENVGGEHLDAALLAMKNFGRIVACGQVSQYQASERYGVQNTMYIVTKRLTFKGFIVSDENMGPKYFAEQQDRVGKWIKEGTFKVLADVADGIDKGPQAFIGMMDGRNFGKTILKIQDE